MTLLATFPSRERLVKVSPGVSSSADPGALESPTWRSAAAGPAVAAVMVLATVLATDAAGVPFRDPHHMVGRRLLQVGCLVALLVALDVVGRACARSRTLTPSLAAILSVRRERWSWRRGAAVAIALVSFYVTYAAYRNLKSLVPILRPDELFDRQLADFDRGLFGGNDPGGLLHSLLGTGISAEILSAVYTAFLLLVPLSLAVALVFAPGTRSGLFYAAALSINWGLGAASYLLLPALGPIYAAPAGFLDLPATGASHLQGALLNQRLTFLSDPSAANTHQSIAAFGSLHTSVAFTAAVATHMMGLGRGLRIASWLFFALTVIATVYFGWHYVLDDVAGLVIAVAALALARGLTGFEPRPAGRMRMRMRMPARAATAAGAAGAWVARRRSRWEHGGP